MWEYGCGQVLPMPSEEGEERCEMGTVTLRGECECSHIVFFGGVGVGGEWVCRRGWVCNACIYVICTQEGWGGREGRGREGGKKEGGKKEGGVHRLISSVCIR